MRVTGGNRSVHAVHAEDYRFIGLVKERKQSFLLAAMDGSIRFIDRLELPEMVSVPQASAIGFNEFQLRFIRPRKKILNGDVRFPIFFVSAEGHSFIIDQVGCQYEDLIQFFRQHSFTLMYFCYSKMLKVNDCRALLDEVKRAFLEEKNASGKFCERDVVQVCRDIYKTLGLTYQSNLISELPVDIETNCSDSFMSILEIFGNCCGAVAMFFGAGIFGTVALGIAAGCYIIVGGYKLYDRWRKNQSLISVEAAEDWLKMIGGVASLAGEPLALAIGLVPGKPVAMAVERIVKVSKVVSPVVINAQKFCNSAVKMGLDLSLEDVRKLCEGKEVFSGSVSSALLTS